MNLHHKPHSSWSQRCRPLLLCASIGLSYAFPADAQDVFQRLRQLHESFKVESQNRILKYDSDARRLMITLPDTCDADGKPLNQDITVTPALQEQFNRLNATYKDGANGLLLFRTMVQNREQSLVDSQANFCDGSANDALSPACYENRSDTATDAIIVVELDHLIANGAQVTKQTWKAMKCYSGDNPTEAALREKALQMLESYFKQLNDSAGCLNKATMSQYSVDPNTPLSCD